MDHVHTYVVNPWLPTTSFFYGTSTEKDSPSSCELHARSFLGKIPPLNGGLKVTNLRSGDDSRTIKREKVDADLMKEVEGIVGRGEYGMPRKNCKRWCGIRKDVKKWGFSGVQSVGCRGRIARAGAVAGRGIRRLET